MKDEVRCIKQANVMTFNVDQIQEVVDSLGLSVNDKGLVTKDDHEIICSGCKTKITQEKFAGVIPGSTHYLCDNPFCYSRLIQSL